MDKYEISVILNSGVRYEFNDLSYDKEYSFENEMLNISITPGNPIKFTARVKEDTQYVAKVEYNFVLDMENYSKVIVPDSGRWFQNAMSLITFWRNYRFIESSISDIKNPLFIFLGKDMYMGTAVGVVGKNYETAFRILEPESNRALNVHTGHIKLQISRGNDSYNITKDAVRDNTFTEYIYYTNNKQSTQQSWVMTMREFSELQRKMFELKDPYVKEALYPMWCSWVDWDSKDINEEMLVENISEGVKLGIINYIVDDGWYGAGLDSDYSVDMEIGDWNTDVNKIPDMKQLVDRVHNMGAKLIIWCAPHAVAEKSEVFKKYSQYLISDKEGNPILNEPQYYSYCFMCEEAREIMSDICAKFAKDWNVDGAKYDLFNWVPNIKCENPNHKHDIDSMIVGLEKTFELINKKVDEIKSDYIVELKQNYGTPFNTRYGTMMRAGDSPFDPETNYMRTLHIQAYTKYALNDYQTFTEKDTPEDIGVEIIKMIAVGIPAYGVNFKKLTKEAKQVIKYYNEWYIENIEEFAKYRIPQNADNTIMKIEGEKQELIFLVNGANYVELMRSAIIFNGSYKEEIVIKFSESLGTSKIIIKDCYGNIVNTNEVICKEQVGLYNVPIGGCLQITQIK